MKIIKNFIAVITLSSLSFGAFAAQEIATLSVSGAKTLDAFEAQVAQKAKKAGASSYRIVSATGHDRLHGTAILYK
ncbi:multiple stress resistance protein BhsA [Pectobacterium betavasculorum]|uniref:Multiple stress resistance protein BhsA n=1 Tax=Pectobacterium betavasculorum TaxID=55207 RepID=A0A093RWJ7_9GAMM|nr:YdgH/BhsA/McbA-like domain containing protein [Pectobacterium betavasculorum]KFX07210.1 multiple stress resistance protein BhsA [Pectobacterium betavasculorum]KFX22424.1 multiple stress resistance protein BhsA [Pectobacterium betavasculorum]